MYVAADVLLVVVDGFMSGVLGVKAAVGSKRIGHQLCRRVDVTADRTLELVTGNSRDVHRAGLAAALDQDDHGCFVRAASGRLGARVRLARVERLVLLLVRPAHLAAYIGLV